jgi:hypothetical protein
MAIGGKFTTAAAWAANLSNSDITSQITSYSFSDGIDTIAGTDPNARIYAFNIWTSASGIIQYAEITLQTWASGTVPHLAGDRMHAIVLSDWNMAFHNSFCSADASAWQTNGVADACGATAADHSQSAARSSGGEWTVVANASNVPALSDWGLLLLATLMGACGWRMTRLHEA